MGEARKVKKIEGNSYQIECANCGLLEWLELNKDHQWEYVEVSPDVWGWLCPKCLGQ